MRQVVLNLHGLGEPHAGVDAAERRYWLSFDAFDALLDRIAVRGELARYVWTFDDGNSSDLYAAERLASRGATGRFFVLAGRLGQPHYLAQDDLRALCGMGMIVGLHGRSHADWRALDDVRLIDETVSARADLADAVGAPVDEVAIPFGRYNRRVLRWLKHCGFSHIHTCDGGMLRDRQAQVWNRVSLRGDMTEAELEAALAGRLPLHREMRRRLSQTIKRRF